MNYTDKDLFDGRIYSVLRGKETQEDQITELRAFALSLYMEVNVFRTLYDTARKENESYDLYIKEIQDTHNDYIKELKKEIDNLCS